MKEEKINFIKSCYKKEPNKYIVISSEYEGGEYYIDSNPRWYKDYHYILISKQHLKLKIKKKLVFLDKYGYPVEQIENRWLINIIRRILYTRKIKIIE